MTPPTATGPDTRPLSILEHARSAMRGRGEIETALAQVAKRLRLARSAIQPEEDVLNDVLKALLADGTVPADVGERVLAIRRTNESALAELGVLGPAERRLQERLVALHRQRADDALHELATELDALLTAARPLLARLPGVHDAEDAINADRVQVWRQATELAEHHGALRGAQRIIVGGSLDAPDQARITSRVSPEVRDLVDNYGHIRQPHLHYPELGAGANREEVRVGQTRIFSGRLTVDSHVDRPVRDRPWTTGDTLDDLHFLTRDDVEAWVPTIAQLTGARDEHEQRMQADARAEAERRPGDDDPQPPLRAGRKMPPPPAALLDRLAREELGDPA